MAMRAAPRRVPTHGPSGWLALVLVGVGLAVVAAAAILGDTVLPHPLSSPAALGTLTGSRSPTPLDSSGVPSMDGAVRVTGTGSGGSGYFCFGPYCSFQTDIGASDVRLSGCYWVTATGTSPVATWGTVTIYSRCSGPMGTVSPVDEVAWDGLFFAVGPRRLASTGTGVNDEPSVYPLDRIVLRGRGRSEGLTAVLRLSNGANVEGWLFPNPRSR